MEIKQLTLWDPDNSASSVGLMRLIKMLTSFPSGSRRFLQSVLWVRLAYGGHGT